MPFFAAHYAHVLIAPALAVWIVLVSGPAVLRALAWGAWAVAALIAVNDVADLLVTRSFPQNTYFQLEALISALVVWPVAMSLIGWLRLRNDGPPGDPAAARGRTRWALAVLFPVILIGIILALNAFLSLLGGLFDGSG